MYTSVKTRKKRWHVGLTCLKIPGENTALWNHYHALYIHTSSTQILVCCCCCCWKHNKFWPERSYWQICITAYWNYSPAATKAHSRSLTTTVNYCTYSRCMLLPVNKTMKLEFTFVVKSHILAACTQICVLHRILCMHTHT